MKLILHLTSALLVLCLAGIVSAEPRSGIIRQVGKERLIIFIHGYRSGGAEAWYNSESDTFWPDMIAEDEFFSEYDVFVYDYFTQFSGLQASPQEISGSLELDMKTAGLDDYSEIVFVGHSMGGIIIRDLLNNNSEIASQVTAVVTYASPFEGSDLANLAAYLSDNQQAVDLSAGANSYLQTVASQWQRFNGDIPSYCAYELEETNGPFGVFGAIAAALVVDRNSAIDGCNRPPPRSLQRDHSNTVKPESASSPTYRFLRYAIDETNSESKVSQTFSVNGVLWAEGSRRAPYSDLFVVSAPRDGGTCKRRIVRQPHRFCPTFEGRPMQIDSFSLGPAEGNDGFATAEITDGGRCVTAYVTSIDDGEGPFGDCKGRSWLTRQEVRFSGYTIIENSTSEQQRVDALIDVGTDEVFSFSQTYDGDLTDFHDLQWRYNLNVSRSLNYELTSTFSLSHRNPEHDFMTSSISDGTLLLADR